MTLNAEQLAKRIGKFTGTNANVVMSGTPEQIQERFEIDTFAREEEPPNYVMRAGSHMEPFLRSEFERETGHTVTEAGEWWPHPDDDGIGCTGDGVVAALDAVLEIKFTNQFENEQAIITRSMAQVIQQMECRQVSRGFLWVGRGNTPPFLHEVIPDPEYVREFHERRAAYRLCVATLTPPYPLPPVTPPEKWTTVDLDVDRPNWAEEMISHLHAWSQSRVAGATHVEATAAIKGLLPEDCGRLLFSNFVINRNRRGAVSIREAA